MENIIYLNKDLKKIDDIKTTNIYVHEWNGFIKIRGITGEEFDKITKNSMIENPITKVMEFDNLRNEILTIIAGVVFPEFSMPDLLWLKNKSYVALRRILSSIQELSAGRDLGLTDEEVEKAIKNMENSKDEVKTTGSEEFSIQS